MGTRVQASCVALLVAFTLACESGPVAPSDPEPTQPTPSSTSLLVEVSIGGTSALLLVRLIQEATICCG